MKNTLILGGIALVFVGIVLLAAGILLSGGNSGIRGGAVVFIGPIPIAFGTDRDSLITVMVLAAVMMVLYFLFFRDLRLP